MSNKTDYKKKKRKPPSLYTPEKVVSNCRLECVSTSFVDFTLLFL